MRFKLYLSFFAAIFLFAHVAGATTFTVTSNADAGPGSLREALTNAAANGTTDQDIIAFNLPGSLPSDRTIRIKSQLPYLTANVVLDGTTQPGSPFGVSDSKVILEPDVSPAYFPALITAGDYSTNNVTKGIEIYGMYIRNFAQITNLITYNASQGSGIYLQGNSSGIKIGAPGKGNVICGVINAIYSDYNYYYNLNSGDVSVQSNIIGLLDDGRTANADITGISVGGFNTITIGGDDANMGNVVGPNVNGVTITRANYYYTTSAQTVIVKNNKIGTDYSGTVDYKSNPLFATASFIKTYGLNINGSNYTNNTNVTISSNVISGQIGYGIFVSYANCSIVNNKIGTDITGTQNLGNYVGIHCDATLYGTIGGTGATDKNYIGFNGYGIEANNSNQVLITQNSIFCNTNNGISVTSAYYAVPFVQVLTYRSDMVAGIATPNCAIELFYSDDCGSAFCQGKEYITTVQSDGTGKWSYSGAINRVVIATATTAQKNTSPFSSLQLLASEPVIKQYTCAYDGSITIPQARDGILFHWDKKEDNGMLTAISDVQNVDHLLPGLYLLTIQYPGGCQKVTQVFEIKDQRIKIQNLVPPIPQCRQKSFPVSGNYSGGTGNVRFSWVNDQGVTVASGSSISNYVPGGTYILHITDDAGCDAKSDPITIVPKPGPDYNLSTMQVQSALCGVANGSIKNITTTVGIGTLTYKWTNSANVVVGTDKDLVNVLGGYYTLTLYDQSECSPYSTQQLYIGQTNSVFIGAPNITSPTCDLNNGAISEPLSNITNASVFVWTYNGVELTAYRNKLNLTNLSEGYYTLTATNPVTGCFNSATFNVSRIQRDVYSLSPQVTATTCGLNNGSIILNFGTVRPVTSKWTNQDGLVIQAAATPTGMALTNLAPGTYTLSVTDSHGCATPVLAQYTVVKTPLLAYDATNNPVKTNDQCDESIGSIIGVAITGGVPPYNYKWVDASGKVAGTSASLTNKTKGTYTLTVTDATPCGVLPTTTLTIGNDKYIPPPPDLSNQRICDPGVVTFYVKNPQTGLYKLYANYNDVVPMYTSANGQFAFQVNQSSDYFISYNVGSCESPRTRVHVEVVLVDISMGNTFTPNADGTNDTWKIKGLEKFPGSTVQIFTRTGHKIFESKDYAIPFDGTNGGRALPSGSYYYIVTINAPCKILSGNLTIVR